MPKTEIGDKTLTLKLMRDILRAGILQALGNGCSFELRNEPKIVLDFYTPTGLGFSLTIEKKNDAQGNQRDAGQD